MALGTESGWLKVENIQKTRAVYGVKGRKDLKIRGSSALKVEKTQKTRGISALKIEKTTEIAKALCVKGRKSGKSHCGHGAYCRMHTV